MKKLSLVQMEAVNGGLTIWALVCKWTGVLDGNKNNNEFYWIWEKGFWE
jgi:hypothetical protein